MGRTQGKFGIGTANRGASSPSVNGSLLGLVKLYRVTVDPASIAAVGQGVETVTCTGVTTSDVVIGVNPPADLTAGLIVSGARVSAADTVKIFLENQSAGAIDYASGTWQIMVARVTSGDE